MFLPVNVNYEQNGNSSWPAPNRADCVPALLSCYLINTIRANETKLILKNESGQFECDPAMVPLVSAILGLVPFILHVVYTHCITLRITADSECARSDRAIGFSDSIPRLADKPSK